MRTVPAVTPDEASSTLMRVLAVGAALCVGFGFTKTLAKLANAIAKDVPELGGCATSPTSACARTGSCVCP